MFIASNLGRCVHMGLPTKQRGLVLFVALIVLVAMSLAGIALVRSVDTNVLIAGNLAFKQGATLAADPAISTARTFVITNSASSPSSFYNDMPSSGFYATASTSFDPKTFDWSTAPALATDAAGNTASYVVHRMCELPGDPIGLNCVRAGTSGYAASSFGSVDYGRYPLSVRGQIAGFRITVRVLGPKNTTSYVQAMVFP